MSNNNTAAAAAVQHYIEDLEHPEGWMCVCGFVGPRIDEDECDDAHLREAAKLRTAVMSAEELIVALRRTTGVLDGAAVELLIEDGWMDLASLRCFMIGYWDENQDGDKFCAHVNWSALADALSGSKLFYDLSIAAAAQTLRTKSERDLHVLAVATSIVTGKMRINISELCSIRMDAHTRAMIVRAIQRAMSLEI